MAAPPEKVSPQLLFCEWDSLQAQNRIGGLDAPRAAPDFELKCVVHIFFLGFQVMAALDTPSFSFKPNGERKSGSGEDASGRGGGRWGDYSLCIAPFSCPFP